MESYTHTQYNRKLTIIFGFFIVLDVIIGSDIFGTKGGRTTAITVAILLIVAILQLLMDKMTVFVREGKIKIVYGSIGILQFNIPIQSITKVEECNIPWYYGIGIHITPSGLVLNPAFGSGLKITLINGKRYIIGTNDKENLLNQINSYKG